MRRTTGALVAAALTAVALASPGTAGAAAKPKPCRTGCPDTTIPSVALVNPGAGSTETGSVNVTGTSSDNIGVASVSVSVDGGSWHAATGTTSWSWLWDTSTSAAGSHSLTVRAVDAAGNAATASESVSVSAPPPPPADTTPPSVSIASPASGATVSGTVTIAGGSADNAAVASVSVAIDGGAWQQVTGTTSWSWNWNAATVSDGTHTIAARSVDSAGNSASTSATVTVSNTTSPGSTSAPDTQGSWVSPEGLKINVSTAGSWTIAQVYSIVKANALDLDKVGPTLTINVQDQYTSQTQTSATLYAGKYSNVKSTMWLQGVNSGFSDGPDETLAHEYGHAWSNYWYYVAHQADWSSYLTARWTTPDGSLTLATDSRTNSSYSWTVREIVADDYRLLFGSSLAISERPGHLNNQIPDPRNVPGLSTFLLNTWRTP